MYTVLKLCWPFEGNHGTDVAPGEHEFDTLALKPFKPLRTFSSNPLTSAVGDPLD